MINCSIFSRIRHNEYNLFFYIVTAKHETLSSLSFSLSILISCSLPFFLFFLRSVRPLSVLTIEIFLESALAARSFELSAKLVASVDGWLNFIRSHTTAIPRPDALNNFFTWTDIDAPYIYAKTEGGENATKKEKRTGSEKVEPLPLPPKESEQA